MQPRHNGETPAALLMVKNEKEVDEKEEQEEVEEIEVWNWNKMDRRKTAINV